MARIAPGTLAPDFTLQDHLGNEHRLSALRGQNVWLAFFRYAACPLCNLRVHRTIQRLEQGEFAGVRLLAVFQSPAASMAEYVGQQKPPFPLLSDPEEQTYALYGLEHGAGGFMRGAVLRDGLQAARLGYHAIAPEGTVSRLPADFLIDRAGVVRDAFYGEHISDHIPFERVASAFTTAPAHVSP